MKVKIIGAGGYGGVGIAELLNAHPEVTISALVDVENVGQAISDLYPHLKGFLDLPIRDSEDPLAKEPVDVVFMATPDGVGMMLDRSSFAGSSTLLNEMVPILVEHVGVPLPEVVRMASLTPARVIGVADRKGSLEAGKDADIAIFNNDFTAWRVLINGRWAI